MMGRIAPTMACIGMFIMCVQWATGAESQSLFGDGAKWLWWPLAFGWLLTAYDVARGGAA